MASSIKKRAVSKQTDHEGDFKMDEEIQADFEGRNLEVQDFNGIRQLLRQLFLKEHVDVTQLSDMLIAQEGIGSVLKQSWNEDEDDDDDDTLTEALDVFGVTTVFNLTSHLESPVVQQLFELVQRLTTETSDEAVRNKINNILESSQKLGLLINERFINLPPKIADPLLTSLQAEMSRMAKRDDSYKFDYFVLICKLYKSKGGKSDVMFSNAEEEIFDKEAEVSIEYNVTSQCDTALVGQWEEEDREMIPYRRILFIQGNKFAEIVQKVKAFVS
ncbi:hypothetical protein PPYR_11393 [Photinus pyralis]|uniref:Protein BCCIP homolog n=1 Tax=Photinus pyralis TaxID=7054 RepID=A0A1Y1KTK7_PHOPY|nr:protein BCCIP homolog [Photinus pyralis]KAB0794554.1 hypothetical protein PPYR_11393 [Photinus pyralis]